MTGERVHKALIVSLLTVLIASSCSDRSGDPQELIRDLRRNGIVLGSSTNLLEELKLEEDSYLSKTFPSREYFSFYNGGLGIDETGTLVYFSLIDPVGEAKEERKHLTELPVLTPNGARLLDMSRRDFIQAYGQPSEIGEPEPLPPPDGPVGMGMLIYRFKDEGNALIEITVVFEYDDPDMMKPLQIIAIYSKGERATYLIEQGHLRIYNLPK